MINWIRNYTKVRSLPKNHSADGIHAILGYDPVYEADSIELLTTLKALANSAEGDSIFVPQEWRVGIECLWETNSDNGHLMIFGKRIYFVDADNA